MSNAFKIGVESKETPSYKNEAEALDAIYKSQEGGNQNFQRCLLHETREVAQYLSDEFKKQLETIVNSQPNAEGKYPNFVYNGYRYGVTYLKNINAFQSWRVKQGEGSGGYGNRSKPTVIYNLQKLYEGEIDSINDILDHFNKDKPKLENISLVNVFPTSDGKFIYVLKRDSVTILGQEQPQQKEEPKKEGESTNK